MPLTILSLTQSLVQSALDREDIIWYLLWLNTPYVGHLQSSVLDYGPNRAVNLSEIYQHASLARFFHLLSFLNLLRKRASKFTMHIDSTLTCTQMEYNCFQVRVKQTNTVCLEVLDDSSMVFLTDNLWPEYDIC